MQQQVSKKGKAPKKVEPPAAPKAVADQKWIDSRMTLVGIKSQRELNKQMFNSVGVLTRRLSGGIRWNFDEVANLARILKQPLEETARRLGFELPMQRTEVIGIVRPDARVTLVTSRAGESVAALSGGDLTLRALIFQTANGPLSGYHDMVLHYRPTKSVEAEAYGRLAVIEAEGEPMAVVGVLDRGPKGVLRVTALNGDKIEGRKILSAAPVEGIIKP